MFLRTRAATSRTRKLDPLGFLVVWQLAAVQVLASVYPTQPVADTVYTSGQLAQVTWKDDGRVPRLMDMGLMEIDLYASSVASASIVEYYVAPLANDVAPVTCSHIVSIPLNLPTNASFFTMRFKVSSPHPHSYSKPHQHSSLHPHTRKPETFYSANFHIVPLTSQSATSDPTADPFPISFLLPQSQPMSVATPTSEPSPAMIAPHEPLDGSTPEDQKTQATHKNGSRSRGGMETAKFRLLFMLWPALVGVSMAL